MSGGYKLQLNHDGAETIRLFAESMPRAMQNILEATERLGQTYSSYEDRLGEHAEDFGRMLDCIRRAQEDAREALGLLPDMLNNVADRIDSYVRYSPAADVTVKSRTGGGMGSQAGLKDAQERAVAARLKADEADYRERGMYQREMELRLEQNRKKYQEELIRDRNSFSQS